MITSLLLIIIYLSFISLGLPDALLGAAWPVMHLDLHVDTSLAGLVSLIVSVGTIVSSLSVDLLVRRFSTAKVTLFSVLLTAIALIGNSLAPNLFFIALMAVPMGLGAGAVDAALNNFVALHYKARHMNWLHCFWGVGAAASPLIMSFALKNLDSWRMGYRIVGFIQAVLVLLLFLSRGLWEKVGTNDDLQMAAEQEVLSLAERVRLPGAKSAMLSFFAYCSLESMTGLWGTTYMVEVRGIDSVRAAQWVALYYTGITLGRFISGFLTFKFSNKTMIRLGLVFIGLSIVLLFLPNSELPLQMSFFFLGFGCAPVFPGLLQDTPQNFGASKSQSMMGIQMASAYVGITLMPPLYGWLSKYIGYALYPYYVALLFVLLFVMVLKLQQLKPFR